MGDVVNSACHIANKAGRNGKHPVIVSSVVHSNLNEHNQGIVYFSKRDIFLLYPVLTRFCLSGVLAMSCDNT